MSREPDQEDATLVRRALGGERGAYELLVRRHHCDLLRALRGITRNREDAEDVAQDTFLRAFRALDRFDLSRPFRPWLWTIGIRLALQAMQKKERRNVSLDAAVSPDAVGAPPAWLADRRAVEHLDRRLLERDVDRALATLDPHHRAVLVLCVVEERSYEEAARILDVPRGTVMSRLSRARLRLRAALGDARGDATDETRDDAVRTSAAGPPQAG